MRGFADVVHSVLVSFSPMPFTGWVSLTYSITRSLTPFDIWMSLMQERCFFTLPIVARYESSDVQTVHVVCLRPAAVAFGRASFDLT